MAMDANTESHQDDMQVNVTHQQQLICILHNEKIAIDCKKTTILEVLKTSNIFKRLYNRQMSNGKELVIRKEGHAVNEDCPCHLIESDKELRFTFIEPATPRQKQTGREIRDQTVTFTVSTRGGKNIRKVMHNITLKNCVDSVLVFAYEGETIEQALTWDARFDLDVLQKDFGLLAIKDGIIKEKQFVVDCFSDKHCKITLMSHSSAKRRTTNRVPNEALSGVDKEAQQSTSSASGKTHVDNDAEQSTSSASGKTHVDHDAEQSTGASAKTHKSHSMHITNNFYNTTIYSETNSDSTYKDLWEQHGLHNEKEELIFREEYGKNSLTCMEVKHMSHLLKSSEAVCQVKINEDAKGTGFCLLNKYILTNAHVISNIEKDGMLIENITAVFEFANPQDPDRIIKVKRLVAMEKHEEHDWALLELENVTSHDLFKCFTLAKSHGGICLIGHPDGGVKKIDPCVIVPVEDRSTNIADKKKQFDFVIGTYFMDADIFVTQNKQLLYYDTCFFYGASGSPVFDEYGSVVAMHTGGFVYKPNKSVIEYAQTVTGVTERIFVKLTERKMFDVLKEFLSCEFLICSEEKHNNIKENFKNIIMNNNTLPKYEGDDQTLKAFFEFCSHREDPVDMDLN